MNITKTVNYTISFSIEAYWNEEGGMGHISYICNIPDMLGAISALEFAEAKEPKNNWQIIVNIDNRSVK